MKETMFKRISERNICTTIYHKTKYTSFKIILPLHQAPNLNYCKAKKKIKNKKYILRYNTLC